MAVHCVDAGSHLSAELSKQLQKAEEEEELDMLWPVNKTYHMQQGINVPA